MRRSFADLFAPCLFLCGSLLVSAPCLAASPEEDARDIKLVPEIRQKMRVCTDNKGHYVAVSQDAPEQNHLLRVYWGDGKRFYLVPRFQNLTGIFFMDPRVYNKNGRTPDRKRDTDYRPLSQVYLEDGACAVRCGERKVDLSLLDKDKAGSMMTAAQLLPSPRQWEPYSLSRDDAGTYYLVDRGATPATQKRFRLFAGPKGNMREQKMTNIVSDSKGDIFATRSGSLRLVLNRSESTWIENSKPHPLTVVPVEENLLMIYNDLGVYTGQRLGTPCDVL